MGRSFYSDFKTKNKNSKGSEGSNLWKANVKSKCTEIIFSYFDLIFYFYLKWYLISWLFKFYPYLSIFLLTNLFTYLSCLSHKLCDPLTKINQSHLYNLLIFLKNILILLFCFFFSFSSFAFYFCLPCFHCHCRVTIMVMSERRTIVGYVFILVLLKIRTPHRQQGRQQLR